MRRIFVIRYAVVAALLMGVILTGTPVQGDTSQISGVRVERDSNGSPSFIISKSGAVQVRDFRMDDPPRLVVDFVGATQAISKPVVEGDGVFVDRVRTSQFATSPALVARVVFDLKGSPNYRLKTDESSVTVEFFSGENVGARKPERQIMQSGFDAPAALPSAPVEKPAQQPGEKSMEKPVPVVEKTAQTTGNEPLAERATAVKQPAVPETKPDRPDEPANVPMRTSWDTTPEGQETEEPVKTPARPILVPQTPALEMFSANAGIVTNKNITIDVQDADIQTVIRSFSEFSNTNIVAGPEVEGKVTAHLKDVPWRQAMDIILKAHGFGYEESYGMIRVSTIEKLTKEDLEVQAAARKKDDLLPLETRIIPLSYANASEMRDALKDIISQRGSIQIENGMNSLIVNDIAKNLDKVAAMVTELDRKTRQVEIVAKLVDVDFDATREIGVRWDLLNVASSKVNGVADATINARSAAPVGTLRFGTVQSWGELQAIIDMLERQNKADIISNPRIVTAENREASILVGKEIPLIVADEAGNPITELTKIGIILRVTPHVNLDKTITLDLHPEVSDLASQATVQGGVVIVMSEADTRVIVGDGETAVIGGLISETKNNMKEGVPVISKIPLIGGLFGFTSDNTKKRELIIFVTPKLVGS